MFENHYYFRLTAVFPGEPGSAGSHWVFILQVLEKNLWWNTKQ